MNDKLIPDLAMKVVLSGLLDSAWGSFSRSTIVRFFVYGNEVKIGVGEGSVHQWEVDALRAAPIEHEWFTVEQPIIIWVEGMKYVPEKKGSEMPRGLIPVHNRDVQIYVSEAEHMIYPAHRCFDINLGKRRMISIISPRSVIRDVVETVHPAFPKEKYRGRINNVEVKVEALSGFFKKGYGIGILRKKGSLKIGERVEGFPLLGKGDVGILLEHVNSDVKKYPKDAWLLKDEPLGAI